MNVPTIFFDLIQILVILCSVLRDLNSHEPINSNYIPMPLASEVQEIAQSRNPRLMKIMNELLIRSLWTREKTESGEKEVVGTGNYIPQVHLTTPLGRTCVILRYYMYIYKLLY